MGVAAVKLEAPSADDFLAVLDAVRSRNSHQPLRCVAGRMKMRKMMFCLSEAMRALDRVAWKEASCMTIMQDVRRGRLLIRYRCSSLDMSTRCGVLGQVRVPEGGALKLRQATLEALVRACTPRRGAPQSVAARRLNKELLTRLTQIIRFYTADAAGWR